VITDGDKAKGEALATQLGAELVGMRGKTQPEYFDVAGAVGTALAANEGPIVLAEPTDNAGGGAPSDNTTILRELIARNASNAAIGPIWDPIAVRLCFDAGLGAHFPLRIGGKTGPQSGTPVDATVEVIGLAKDAWQKFGPTSVPVGDCAGVRIGGVEVVLITKRTQAFAPQLFTNVGIDALSKSVLVVKSTNHFMAGFGPIAKQVLYVDSDAPLSRDYRKIDYKKVNRPIWPLDEKTSPGLIF
jgi:microcystin degradation protein MlrC